LGDYVEGLSGREDSVIRKLKSVDGCAEGGCGVGFIGHFEHAGSISNMDEKSVSHDSDLSSSKLSGSAESPKVEVKVFACSPLLLLDGVCST
jgi:hypothetical protein